MKTLLKIIAGLVVVLVVLALAAPMLISKDAIKQQLIAQVQQATGRTLAIEGDLSLRLFPVAGVTAEKVSLSNPKGADAGAFVTLSSLALDVETMPLLQKQLVVITLHLKDPVVALEVSAAGAPNWDFSKATDGAAPAANAPQKTDAPSAQAPLAGLSLADVKLSNGTISYHNRESGDRWQVQALNVALKMAALGKPLFIDASARLQQKPVAVAGEMLCQAQQCEFKNAALAYDQLKATGALALDYGKAVPHLRVNLSTDTLDLTPFMPAEQPKQASAAPWVSDAQAASREWSRTPIDFSALRLLSADVVIASKQILARKIHLENATLKAKLAGGKLAAEVREADIYGGKGSVSLFVDAIGARVEKRISLRGVQAEPLLVDAMEFDRLSGAMDMELAVAGRGRSEHEIVRSLQGNGSLKFTDGAIKGLNIADMARNVQSAFKATDRSAQKTDFAELGGSFTIVDGVVKNSDLAMKAPLLRVSGQGQVDLPQQRVDYRLTPELVETLKGQGGKDKQGLGVPIIIEGPLDAPSYRPDLAATLQDALQNPEKVKDTVNSIKDQFKGENKKEMLNNLKGLFK